MQMLQKTVDKYSRDRHTAQWNMTIFWESLIEMSTELCSKHLMNDKTLAKSSAWYMDHRNTINN